ncbi:UNVERIFIED_CONTAM: hypothetical protein RMT77_018060 [Armadillidium vulgare]
MGAKFLKALTFCALLTFCYSKTSSNYSDEGPNAFGVTNPRNAEADHVSHVKNETHGNDTGHHEKHERFPIATMDFARVQTPIIIGLWLFCACLGKIAFHMAPKLSNMFPESCLLIIMGLIIGGIFVAANPHPESQVSPLTADTFFLYMLPPIILDAGYFMPNRLFFDHLGTILVFAVIGTIWNVLTIGVSLYAVSLTGIFGMDMEFPVLHILLFSSLISAVDPVAVLAVFEEIHVEEVLFILVFGESLLNDGVTVVLYHMFEGFSEIGENNLILMDIFSGLVSFLLIALGGTLIGIIWGFLTAFVTRFTHQVRVIEPIFVFVMSFLAYLNAEMFHWSGILAITFCGITMKNYTEQNMSHKSQTTTKYAMKMLASSSETVIFLFLGVATVHGTEHHFNWVFVVVTIVFCSVYRVLGVLILSAMCNRFRVLKIDFVQKFVMSYGGLRGAIAFALAITINAHHIPLAPMFVTTTIAVVFFTVFVQGMTIKPLVEKLGVKKSTKRKLNMNERLHGRSMDYIMAGVEDITGKFGNHVIRGWFKRFHNDYLQPLLVRNYKAEPKLLQTLSELKMQEAMSHMNQKPTLTDLTDLESFSRVLQNNFLSKNNIAEWNLDTEQLEYKAGDRDINDAKFHHILSDDYHPIKARRQSTYKRHAVRDDELLTQTDFHNKMYQRARHVAMTSIRNRKVRRQMDFEAPERPMALQQNGTAVRLKTDYLEESTRDNKGFVDSENMFNNSKNKDSETRRVSKKGPTIAETILPWKRFSDEDVPTVNSQIKRSTSIVNSENGDFYDSPQTMAECQLPWKRTEDDDDLDATRQCEFPPWATNKEYLDSYSPSNTILGKIAGFPEWKPTIKDIFAKRHSSANLFGLLRRGSTIDDMPTLRNSAKDDIYARRSSLKSDPTSHRRESLKDFKDLNAFRAHIQATELAKQQENQNQRQIQGQTQTPSQTQPQTQAQPQPQTQTQPQTHTQHSHPDRPDRRSSRESIGQDSLLNTVIVEEDQKDSKSPKISKVPSRDHVITMNPSGGNLNDTQF